MRLFHRYFPPLLLGVALLSIICTIFFLGADAVNATYTVLRGH